MAADTVTMSASHYERLTNKAGEHRAAGLYGEYGLTIAKRNRNALVTIGAVGVGWYFLSGAKFWNNIPLFKEKDYWWLKGLVILAIGWYLWRKQNSFATVVLALGAALFAQSWRVHQNMSTPGSWEAADPYNWDAGAGQWVKTATGGEVLQPAGGTDQSEQFAQRVFDNARAA